MHLFLFSLFIVFVKFGPRRLKKKFNGLKFLFCRHDWRNDPELSDCKAALTKERHTKRRSHTIIQLRLREMILLLFSIWERLDSTTKYVSSFLFSLLLIRIENNDN